PHVFLHAEGVEAGLSSLIVGERFDDLERLRRIKHGFDSLCNRRCAVVDECQMQHARSGIDVAEHGAPDHDQDKRNQEGQADGDPITPEQPVFLSDKLENQSRSLLPVIWRKSDSSVGFWSWMFL